MTPVEIDELEARLARSLYRSLNRIRRGTDSISILRALLSQTDIGAAVPEPTLTRAPHIFTDALLLE